MGGPKKRRKKMLPPDGAERFDAPVEIQKCGHPISALSTDAYGSMVSIIVGNEVSKRTFQVHEGLLKHHSDYFKAALKDDWKKDPSKPIELPEDDPSVFQEVFRWLYTGKLYHELSGNGRIPLRTRTICKIYIFGDMRGSPGLCNAAIDLLFQVFCQEWAYPLPDAQFVYKNTCKGSALRKFFAVLAAETYSWRRLEIASEEYPKELLVDVLIHLRKSNLPLAPPNVHDVWIQKSRLAVCGKFHAHGALKVPSEP
ncbi:hypothetical protein IQ07DRAFT_682685 [Pyrenochaeta sp. DS3sAY3a]|nr:hypothetical protein IQ07DRAFT_682685 [Pyrenochaeta sp. DS3sAY3a]